MKLFEIFNSKSKRVFYTHQKTCIPNKSQLYEMIKLGYKIKIDNKIATKKIIDEIFK